MRVLLICDDPRAALENPDGTAVALADLGCRVEVVRFDLGDLDLEDVRRHPPTILLFEAADHLPRAVQALKMVSAVPEIEGAPRLLIVKVPRLSGLDFSAGFDDFILSPIVPAELYARMRQLDWKTATFDSDEVIKVGDLVVDLAGYEAKVSGRKIGFTHQEFELLRFLAQNRGRVFTREKLLQKVWGYQYAGGTRTVDIHVRRIRAKLGTQMGGLVVTVRNVGYKMRAPETGDDDSDS